MAEVLSADVQVSDCSQQMLTGLQWNKKNRVNEIKALLRFFKFIIFSWILKLCFSIIFLN